MANFQKMASVGDIKPGEAKVFEVNGEAVALYNVDGNFYATTNTCLHKGGPLGEGMLEGENIICPWHGWQFNVKTGVSPVVPTAKVQTYPVKVEGNDVFVGVE